MKIHAHSLNKVYIQGEKRILALNNIDIDIAEGKFTAIVGTSGCGKSTLLRTLSAIEEPSEGRPPKILCKLLNKYFQSAKTARESRN